MRGKLTNKACNVKFVDVAHNIISIVLHHIKQGQRRAINVHVNAIVFGTVLYLNCVIPWPTIICYSRPWLYLKRSYETAHYLF